MDRYTERLLSGYVDTALWAGSDENGHSLERNHDARDIEADAWLELLEDIRSFALEVGEIGGGMVGTVASAERVGHDFYLTRNRHGAGFWDGDYPDELGRRLTDAAHVYGTSELMPAGDGTLYLTH